MNQRRQGGGGGGGGGQQQGSPNQLTVATSKPVTATTYVTSTAYPSNQPTSTTSSSASSTPTSTAKASNKIPVGPIIGGTVGGVAVLSLLAVLLALCLRGRKKKRKVLDMQEKRSTAERTSYAGVNSAFSGVPFTHSPIQGHHDSNSSLLPLPLSTPGTSPYSRADMRGGELSPYSLERHGSEAIPYPPPSQGGSTSPYLQDRHIEERSPSSVPGEWHGGQTSPYALPGQRDSHFESEHFLQMYGENTPTASRESLGRIDTEHQNVIVSPISPHGLRPTATTFNISPQTAEESFDAPPGISVPMFLTPQTTRDTMGFPVDNESIRSPAEQPYPSFPVEPMPLSLPTRSQDRDIERDYQNIPVASPSPGQPLISQSSLGHLIRQGMTTPEPNLLKPDRILSSEFQRESPILGNRHPVRMYAPPPSSKLQQNLTRNASQKTVSSMSSIGHMVSDEELDRLGVGRI